VATNSHPFAFTFGYIRAFYRASINPRGASYPTGGSNLAPNTQTAISFPSTYMDYVVRTGHRLRFTFSNASPYSIATDTGNVVTMFSGINDETSQVRMPVATTLPVVTPDLAQGVLGAGGPVIAVSVGIGATAIIRRRRGAKNMA
jgi:hypothetical protein